MQAEAGHQSGREIIGRTPQPTRQILETGNTQWLEDIEESEQKKAGQQHRPTAMLADEAVVAAHTDEDQRHSHHLVEHDHSRIPHLEALFRRITDRDRQVGRKHCENDKTDR